jgi:hypothetical protein
MTALRVLARRVSAQMALQAQRSANEAPHVIRTQTHGLVVLARGRDQRPGPFGTHRRASCGSRPSARKISSSMSCGTSGE